VSSSSKLIAGTAILAVVAAGGAAFAAVRLSETTGSAVPIATAPYGHSIAGAGLGGGRVGGRGFGGGLGPGPHIGFRGGFTGPGFFGGASAAVSGYLGVSPSSLHADLQRGETLAQIAKDQSKTVAGLIAVMLADQKRRIDIAVSRGFLTEAQAQRLESSLQGRISDMVNGIHTPRGTQVPTGPAAATA
jgi:hypothetical protein